jgi:CrcB protein
MEAAVTGTEHHSHHPPADWPVDTDVESNAARRRIDPRILLVIGAGGFVGGLARYELVTAWSPGAFRFPWSTFVVNTLGAFVLAGLVILTTDVLVDSRYLRPLIGTGFCGALTTFSSVVVAIDRLAAHGHLATGVGYGAASLLAGAAAAGLGVLTARSIPSRATHRTGSVRA